MNRIASLNVKEKRRRVLILHITPRERALLLLLASGISTNELAGRFRVSERVMQAHLTALFARMGAASRTEAVAAASRRGLLVSTSPSSASETLLAGNLLQQLG